MVKIWADAAWNDYCQFFDLNQKKQTLQRGFILRCFWFTLKNII